MKSVIAVLDYELFYDSLWETAEYAASFNVKIWLRIKNRDTKLIYEIALHLRKFLPESYLILSERPDIATICFFDGVHLNSHCYPPDKVKQNFPELDIGYSAHSLEEIYSVYANYYTLSPVFQTKKEFEVKPLGAVNVSRTRKKIYALGGVNSNNIGLLQGKGFYGVAGISLISELDNIKKYVYP